jgi:hypothetical protein
MESMWMERGPDLLDGEELAVLHVGGSAGLTCWMERNWQ